MWRVRAVALKLTQLTPQINPIEKVRPLRLFDPQGSSCSFHAGVSRIAHRHMSSRPKRLCTENMSGKKIGTHNGTFHCDEVLACFFLRQLPEYKVGSARIFGSNGEMICTNLLTELLLSGGQNQCFCFCIQNAA